MPVLSLRVRMLLLVLLAVVPALGLVLYSGLEARYQEGARAQEQVLQLVQRISRDQEQAIKETRQLLITLAQLPAVRERDAEACSRILGGISRLHVRYANLRRHPAGRFGVLQRRAGFGEPECARQRLVSAGAAHA